ncbi:MAG TPA: sugar ABC transporter substrate-binding protein [Verrucomicrobiae bacterium]|nr:sugar ABC transporter substrate-binding protein [Verrucomicrobiae bacterium]
MRRWLGVLGLAAFVAGCAASRPGPVKLRMWAMGREGEVVGELVRDFERGHPGIHVEVQQIPWTAAHEKLLTAVVGGSLPDVGQLGNSWISEFGTLESLVPLDPFLVRGELSRDAYFGGIWDTNVLDGVTYGVPWYVDTRLLFYRKDLLERAGYKAMPTDWKGWKECLRAVKARGGPGHYGIFLPTNEWMTPVVLGLQSGSPLLADGGTRGAFEEAAYRRAFDYYLGMFREGLAPAIGFNEIANKYQELSRGTFAMMVTGPWELGEFTRRLPDSLQSQWSTAAMPGPDGPGVSFAGGSSLVLFHGTKHPEEAWELVRFLSEPAQQVRFWRLTGDLPARREAWADTALTADARTRAFGDQLTRTEPCPKVPEWEEIATRVYEQADRAIRGATSPDSALATLDRLVDKMLEKRRWLAARRSAAGHRGRT